MDSTLAKKLLLSLPLVFACLPLTGSAAPHDLVMVLDNSGSMKKNDPDFLTGVAVRKFFRELGGDSRVAILVFDEEARLLMPLTPLDEASRADFLRSLDEVDYQGLYTDSPSAIERAVYELKVNGRPAADWSIVFMTDGIVDTGNEAMDAHKSGWLRNDLAAEAAEHRIRIFGIAFTDNADFLLIQSLSKRTSGEYFRAYSAADIEGVFRRITERLATAEVPAGGWAYAPGRPETGTALAAPPGPALLPEPELPAAAPFASDAPAVPGLAKAETSYETAARLALEEDMGVSESTALPTLPEVGISVEALVDSAPKQPQAPAGGPGATGAPAATPGAELPGSLDPQQTTLSAAAEVADRSGEIVLPAPPVALSAAGVVGVVVVAGLILRRRRRSPDKPELEDHVPKAFLNDLGGITDKPSYELGESLTVVGRIPGSDADGINYVVIPEPTVGRRHAFIEFKNHCFWVADQNSLNGTFINDKRVLADTRLKHGDRIRFHKHEFEFLLLDMFETDRTMMSETVFADLSRAAGGDDRIRPLAPGDPREAASTTEGN